MRVTGITCAKNEGPFILEWIVYHRLIGFTDIVVFTNDCTDGTDGLLDRLDEMGYIKHLPNPRILNSALRFQKAALEFAVGMREVRNADWFMSFDSDEFVNITVGHGTVTDLVDSYKDPEMICVCQLQHGCAGMETYTPGLSIEQFQMAQRFEADPGTKMRRDLERGLKTLVSGKAPITEINNHKPAVEVEREKDVRWLYGDDQRVPQQIINGKGKSLPYQGAYARATLNHYATRSMESFLVQSHRGNAVKTYEHADIKYWKRYNHNAIVHDSIACHAPKVKKALNELLNDKKLMSCQTYCEEYHRKMIDTLKKNPSYQKLYQRIGRLHSRYMSEQAEKIASWKQI